MNSFIFRGAIEKKEHLNVLQNIAITENNNKKIIWNSNQTK